MSHLLFEKHKHKFLRYIRLLKPPPAIAGIREEPIENVSFTSKEPRFARDGA